MKKLIMALAVAFAAVITEAATVSWTCTNVQKDGIAVSGTAYAFFTLTSAFEGTDWVSNLAGKGADAVTAAMAGANKSYTPSAAGTYTYNASSMGANLNQTDIGLTGGENYTLFLVVFDTATITDSSNFYVTSTKATTINDNSSSLNKLFALGNQSTASNADGAWNAVAVPEPTSGLLMLVGLVGLALRRKRA